MSQEVWRPIPDCNGRYEVSNMGNVRNSANGQMLKPRPIPRGYLRVQLPVRDGRKDFYIHRLVAEAFCDHPNGRDVINHIDNNPRNNIADNLEWVTQFYNVHYGMKQKRYRLNAVRVIGNKDGQTYEFISSRQAASVTGCDHSAIIQCCKGKARTTHGFTWRYAEVV